MRWFYNLKIGKKLICSFVFIAFLAGIVGVVGIYEIKKTDSNYSTLYNKYGSSQIILGTITEDFQRTRVELRNILIDKEDSKRQASITLMKTLEKDINDKLQAYEKNCDTDSEKK